MNMEQKTEKWDAIAYSICKVTAKLYVGISRINVSLAMTIERKKKDNQ